MAFVGIFTGFSSIGRRRALRRTWLPADRQGLQRLVARVTAFATSFSLLLVEI
jgi:hypothetical protein